MRLFLVVRFAVGVNRFIADDDGDDGRDYYGETA